MVKSVMMEGYVNDRCVTKTVEDVEYEITTYQGEHRDEYLVREVKSGQCELFYKGLLQLSWKEVDRKKTGLFTVYENGKVLRSEEWNRLNNNEYRYIENCKNRTELVIEGYDVVYRGGFDNVTSMKREGKGMEYDKESGRVLRCGMWKNDELFQVIQEFESDEVMIEYEVEEGEENVSVLNRHPVYEGGYVFDEEKREYVRHGEGCDIEGGIAVREGKWERGGFVDGVDLFDGWYVKMGHTDLFDWGFYRRGKVNTMGDWRNVDKRITKLVIPSNCCNEKSWKTFDVSELKCLKSIEIGDECFENVKEVKLIGLKKLESVVIGKKSFRRDEDKDRSGHFYLKDCENLKELKMGRYSFSDFAVCEIANVPSLEVIEMGELNEESSNFYYASLELKSDGDEMK